MNDYKGKFIVIDGTDGSGKATQTELLVKRLVQAGFQVEIADFPQYGAKSAGLVEEYLNGKYGEAKKVGPYRASIFYAIDRYDASFKIKKWLKEGRVVISNRYVTSNMAHQGGKISNALERKIYLEWLYKLEYEIFNIPKPDINIILHVDAAIAQKLVDKKGSRDYVGGVKRDIHEADISHLRDAEQTYLGIANNFPDISLIKCTRNNEIMAREEINDLLWRKVYKYLKIKPELAPNFKDLHERNTIQQSATCPSGKRVANLPAACPPLEGQAGRQSQTCPPPARLLRDRRVGNRKLFVQRLSPAAKLPSRAYEHDAGFDLYAADYYSLMPGERAVINTGIKIAIPNGLAGLIWDKGGLAKDGIHTMAGVIDSGFRGEVTVNLINLSNDIYNIAPGQKIAQLLIQKIECPEIIEAEINDKTDRSACRFGSSGIF